MLHSLRTWIWGATIYHVVGSFGRDGGTARLRAWQANECNPSASLLRARAHRLQYMPFSRARLVAARHGAAGDGALAKTHLDVAGAIDGGHSSVRHRDVGPEPDRQLRPCADAISPRVDQVQTSQPARPSRSRSHDRTRCHRRSATRQGQQTLQPQ